MNAICCFRLLNCVGYFVYFKFTRVFILLLNVFSSVKEKNSLISKRMSKIYYLENLTFSNVHFLGRKIRRNALALKSKKVAGVCFGITVFSCLSSTNPFLRFLLN